MTYTAQSDIWSLGLSMLETAAGGYPYPPDTYNNVFAQLSAIVDGEPPTLPKDLFSENACDFVGACLNKNPTKRPTYASLLKHPFLRDYRDGSPEWEAKRESTQAMMAAWVTGRLEERKAGVLKTPVQAPLHSFQKAPNTATSSSSDSTISPQEM